MKNYSTAALCVVASFCLSLSAPGETTNAAVLPLAAPALPDVGVSFVRVLGALALVIGVFLGGVWLFKNWQRLTVQRGRAPKLNVLETRSLGGRQALSVVGYEQERFLISSSPAGVTLLSHLPSATEEETAPKPSSPPPFARALAQVLKGRS